MKLFFYSKSAICIHVDLFKKNLALGIRDVDFCYLFVDFHVNVAS